MNLLLFVIDHLPFSSHLVLERIAVHNIRVAAEDAKRKRDHRIPKNYYVVGELVLVQKRKPEKGRRRCGGFNWVAKVTALSSDTSVK